MARKRQSQVVPPYVSFRTFIETLDWLEQEGLPQRLDESVWKKRHSGPYGAQLMAAFRFLGLMSPDGSPTELLHQMVFNRGQRPSILAQLLRSRYSFVDIDLARATPSQLEDCFKRAGLDGDTLRKAVTFYMHAASATDIHLSPFLARRRRGKSLAKKEVAVQEPRIPGVLGGQEYQPALVGLLTQAHNDGPMWTVAERERWLKAWIAAIEMVFPAKDE